MESAVPSRTAHMERPALRRLNRHSVREHIQGMILSGQFRSCAKLRQIQLARQFGVSQAVIREALLELSAFGLVETHDHRGAFVSKLSPDRLFESLEVRAVLEGWSARLCSERVSRLQLREMAALVNQIHEHALNGQLEQMTALDREFHSKLLHLSGNSTIVRVAEESRVLGVIIRAGRNPDVVRAEHLAILQAIGEGHAEEAEQRTREHILAIKGALQELHAQGKDIIEWCPALPPPPKPVDHNAARERKPT